MSRRSTLGVSQYDDKAAYMRAYRKANTDSYTKAKKRDAARRRALARLGRIYPDVLAALIEEEQDTE